MYYGYIYRTTNLVNGKTYIGQHKKTNNKIYRGSGTILQKAFKKYGLDNFKTEELLWCKNKEELNRMEELFIYEERLIGKAEYNISSGGEGAKGVSLYREDNPFYGKKHTTKTKRLISEKHKGKRGYWKDKHFSEEHIIKTRRTGSKHSKETRFKMSETRSNSVICEYCKKLIKNKTLLKKHITNNHKEDRKEFSNTPNISLIKKEKGVRNKNGYRVKVNGKYIGIRNSLEEATKLRDDYRESKGLPKVINRIQHE